MRRRCKGRNGAAWGLWGAPEPHLARGAGANRAGRSQVGCPGTAPSLAQRLGKGRAGVDGWRMQRHLEHPAPSGEPGWAVQGCHLLGRDPNSRASGTGSTASHPSAGWVPLGCRSGELDRHPGVQHPRCPRLGCSVAGRAGRAAPATATRTPWWFFTKGMAVAWLWPCSRAWGAGPAQAPGVLPRIWPVTCPHRKTRQRRWLLCSDKLVVSVTEQLCALPRGIGGGGGSRRAAGQCPGDGRILTPAHSRARVRGELG